MLDWRCSWDDPRPGSDCACSRPWPNGVNAMAPCNWCSISMVSTRSPAALPGWSPLCGGWQSQRQSTPRSAGGSSASALSGRSIGTAAFQERYTGVFGSNFIAELFCQLAWVQDHVDPTAIELPSAEPPFAVRICCPLHHGSGGQGLALRYWRQVLEARMPGWTVGLVGSPPAARRRPTTPVMVRTSCCRALG